MAPPDRQALLRQRLLSDIKELQQKPYPGIALHIQDENALERACLVLSPPGQDPLHLSIRFGKSYPLEPPNVTIQSAVSHPNVFDDYICASILNTAEGYTSAYTLKGICIQLLSFFSDDRIEQLHGGGAIDRNEWQREEDRQVQDILLHNPNLQLRPSYQCKKCGFGQPQNTVQGAGEAGGSNDVEMSNALPPYAVPNPDASVGLVDLPNEVLLLITDLLDEEDLLLAAKAWNGFGRVMRRYNVIHVREMQCFTLKKGFNEAALGVGVHVQGKEIQSEFDFISLEAFDSLDVGRSVQGLDFTYWLPLPISQTHWAFRARKHLYESLRAIGRAANVSGTLLNVIYSFLNDVVVRLSRQAENGGTQLPRWMLRYTDDEQVPPKSTLTHASEKAIESYLHLYHLLLCMALDDPTIVTGANAMIQNVIDGKCDKASVPNLGHLLIMFLISDHEITEDITKAIIKEAITRNVVWMLDARGTGMAELSFLETDAVSEYRLRKTFEAGLTSYRLLMFAKLMQDSVNSAPASTPTTTFISSSISASTATPTRPSISDRCTSLFHRHGSPPRRLRFPRRQRPTHPTRRLLRLFPYHHGHTNITIQARLHFMAPRHANRECGEGVFEVGAYAGGGAVVAEEGGARCWGAGGDEGGEKYGALYFLS